MTQEQALDKAVKGYWRWRMLHNKIRRKAYKAEAKQAYGEKSRRKWRIKRMKHNRRLNKHKVGICPQNPF